MKISAEITDTVLLTITRADGTVFEFLREWIDKADPLDTIKEKAESFINAEFLSDGIHFRVYIISIEPPDFIVWSGPVDMEPLSEWWL